jgi:hypothetical protein
MHKTTLRAGDAAQKIRELEQYLEWPVACIVVAISSTELGYVFPAEADDSYIRAVLAWVARGSQDASKSL